MKKKKKKKAEKKKGIQFKAEKDHVGKLANL